MKGSFMANLQLATGLMFSEGPACDLEGRMWVGEMAEGHKFVTRIADDGSPVRIFAPGGTPSGNAFAGNGNLWTTGGLDHTVLCTTLDGQVLLRISGPESGYFLLPNDMAVRP